MEEQHISTMYATCSPFSFCSSVGCRLSPSRSHIWQWLGWGWMKSLWVIWHNHEIFCFCLITSRNTCWREETARPTDSTTEATPFLRFVPSVPLSCAAAAVCRTWLHLRRVYRIFCLLSKTLPKFMVLPYWTDILLLNARLSELLMNGCYSPRTLKQGPNSTESPEKVCKSC